MKKRILSLLTVLFLLIANIVHAGLYRTECEEEAGLLTALEILPEGAMETYSPSEQVERKRFVSMLVKAALISGEAEVEFSDCTLEGAEGTAAEAGIISGYSDGTFRPGNIITIGEAAKMAVVATGVGIIMDNHEFPMAYMQKASEYDILKGIGKSASDEVTMSDAVVIIYNMLNAPAPFVGNVPGEIIFDDDVTLLSERYGIYHSRGIVTGNRYTRLNSTLGTGSGYVEIDGVMYSEGESGAEDFFGYNVEFYYREEKNERELVYITYSGKTSDLLLYSDELSRYEDGTFYYYNDVTSSRETRARTSPDAAVIYNGKALIGITENDIFVPEYGYIVLIDNNGDNLYDVISVYDIRTVVFNFYDETNNIIYDKYKASDGIFVDEDDSNTDINIHDKNKKSMALSDVKEWDVLEVIQSRDKSYTEITVLEQSVAGQIKSMGEDESGKRFCILEDGKTYYLGNILYEYMDQRTESFKIGNSYIFYLDTRGNIVGYQTQISEMNGAYGYLITVRENEIEDESFYLKILKTDGNVEMMNSAKKVRIDGESYNAGVAYMYLYDIVYTGSKMTPDVIWYKTNSQGQIIYIDTVLDGQESGDDLLRIKGKTQAENYNNGQKTIAGKVNFSDESLVFIVPAVHEGASPDEYKVGSPSDVFVHYNPYTVTGYSKSRTSPYSDVVLYVGEVSDTIQSKAETFLVQKITVCLDEEDLPTYELTLLGTDGEKAYITHNAEVLEKAQLFSGLGETEVLKGDVIRIALNAEGQISTIQVIYSPENDRLYLTANPTRSNIPYPFDDYTNLTQYYNIKSDFNEACRISFGNVFYKDDGYIRVANPIFDLSDKNILNDIKNGSITLENFKIENVFKYEKDGSMPYRSAEAGDIRDYNSTGMASRVLVRTNDAATAMIVIY